MFGNIKKVIALKTELLELSKKLDHSLTELIYLRKKIEKGSTRISSLESENEHLKDALTKTKPVSIADINKSIEALALDDNKLHFELVTAVPWELTTLASKTRVLKPHTAPVLVAYRKDYIKE